MGALAILDGIARVPTSGTQIADAGIPAAIARDSELPTVNNGTFTVSGGTGISGSASFTANQAGNSSVSLTNTGVLSVNGSTGDVTIDTGGSVPAIQGTGSYILMQGTRANTSYAEGTTVAPTGSGAERYGVTYGRSNGSGSGDFQARTTTIQGGSISGGTWRSQSAGVTNQYAVNLMVRIS